MKPMNRNNDPEFYSKCGKKGAIARWSNNEQNKDDELSRYYFDRKGGWYCDISRSDGKEMKCYHSINRRDQLDVYINGFKECSIGKRRFGEYIMDLV